MRNEKGFIQTPLLIAIITGILVLGGGGYLGVKKYQSYQAEKIKKEVASKAEVDAKQKAQDEAQQQKDLEVEKLKQEVEALKNKKPQIIQQTIVKEVPTPSSQGNSPTSGVNDLPSIIQQWRPRIAYIVCEWRSSTGEVYARASGSGLFVKNSEENPLLIVITNRHVIADGPNAANSCEIALPGMNETIRVSSDSLKEASAGLDWGLIEINSSNNYMKSIALSTLSISCKETALVGEEIVVLGYPGIGSQTDITATEGIISGRDGNYYITSAKVEHGNSGGVALLQKNNCYLGIPTFAQAGEIESLARILDSRIMFQIGQ